jgi:hypothetical protein
MNLTVRPNQPEGTNKMRFMVTGYGAGGAGGGLLALSQQLEAFLATGSGFGAGWQDSSLLFGWVYGEDGQSFMHLINFTVWNMLWSVSAPPGPSCSLNVYVGSSSLLGSAGQKALAQELQGVFNAAGVGINFVSSTTGADFVVGLGGATTSGNADTTYGEAPPGTNAGIVYLSTMLAYNPSASDADLGGAAGQVAAHEIGHQLFPGQ